MNFRSPLSNQRYTKQLFYEMADNPDQAVYTLKDRDTDKYLSLYRLYMEEEDPTEFSFANKHLDGHEHWEMLCRNNWFKPYVNRWRAELELKIRAKALKNLIELSKGSDPKSQADASKFLLTRNWRGPTESKVGRPSREAIKQEAIRLFEESSETKEDYKRILNG